MTQENRSERPSQFQKDLRALKRGLGRLMGVNKRTQTKRFSEGSLELGVKFSLKRQKTLEADSRDSFEAELAARIGLSVAEVKVSLAGHEIVSADPNAAVRQLNKDRLGIEGDQLDQIMGEDRYRRESLTE